MLDLNLTTVGRIVASQDVIALDATAPILDAAKTMSERRIGSVGVRDGGQLVGLVTERDLVTTVLARGGNASQPIREALRPGIPRVRADASEAACAALMRDHATRHLLVEDRGRVVGVVSMTDLVQVMLEEKQFLIEQLNTYIRGAEVPAEPLLQSTG